MAMEKSAYAFEVVFVTFERAIMRIVNIVEDQMYLYFGTWAGRL